MSDAPEGYKELAEFSADVFRYALKISEDKPLGFVFIAIDSNTGRISTTSSNPDKHEVANLLVETAHLIAEVEPTWVETEPVDMGRKN